MVDGLWEDWLKPRPDCPKADCLDDCPNALKAEATGCAESKIDAGLVFVSAVLDVDGVMLIGASVIEDEAKELIIPGYGDPLALTTCHAMIVPSLQYAYTIGGGGTSTFSPDTAV